MEIAVGVLLGLAGLLLVGIVAALVAGRRTDPLDESPAVEPVDDLPDFLEHPPGSTTPRPPAPDGVVTLTAPHRPDTPPATPPRRRVPTAALVALAGLVVLLLVAAVIVTALPGPDGRADGDRQVAPERQRPGGDEARLRFGGLVLEEHAVGVTVTYPELVLEADADGPVASLELPTWNCLAAEAPDDAADAGCVPGRSEYAEVRSPDLDLTRDGAELRLSGDFATSTRPAGGDPEPTGRTYDLVITVSPDGSASPGRWAPASGDLELDDHVAPVVDGEMRIHE